MRRAQIQLERVLTGLERELIHADDDELRQVVAELGLKPSMKGSVALLGVTRRLAPWGYGDRSALPHGETAKPGEMASPGETANPGETAKPKRAAERRRPKGSSRGEL